MTTSDKHTDQIFRKLNGLESQPSPHVWGEIESRLAGEGKKRRLLPFLKWGAAAVVLFAAGLLWLFNQNGELSDDGQISYLQKPEPLENIQVEDKASKDFAKQAIDDAAPGENSSAATSRVSEDKLVQIKSKEQMQFDDKQSGPSITRPDHSDGVASSDLEDEQTSRPEKFTPLSPLLISDVEFHSAADQMVPVEEQSSPKPGPVPFVQRHSWVIGGEYSPTYAFRDVSGPAAGSSRESGMMTGGGGFSLTFKMDDRWQLETGVNYARMGQEVETVSRSDRAFGLMQADAGLDVTGVQLNNTMGVIQHDQLPGQTSVNRTFSAETNEIVQLSSAETGGQPLLEQSLGYVKVPVTLRYKVFARQNIDVFLAGGFSANWLVDNDAYLRMSGQRQYVGKTGGLSDAAISSHAGIGMSIPVFRHFHLRMEPRVDYFISDINQSSSVRFRPYSFGVYTGVFYEF